MVAPVALLLYACNDITGAGELTIKNGPGSSARPPSASGDPSSQAPTPSADARPDDGTESSPPEEGAVTVVFPQGLDFGDVACGTAPPAKKVELHNSGASEITFDAGSSDPNLFSVVPATGTVAGGGTTVLEVQAKTVPTDGGVGPRTGNLTITTSAPSDKPHVHAVRLVASGAVFTISPAGSISFGTVQVDDLFGEKRSIKISNSGNAAGTLALKISSTSFGVSPSTATVSPGESVSRSVEADPLTSGYKSSTLHFETSTPICEPLPKSISLSCTGE